MREGKSIMQAGSVQSLTDELAVLFDGLIERQIAMHALTREKLEAMRRADVNSMLTAARRENDEATRAAEFDRRREDIVTRLCHRLGMKSGPRGTAVTLGTLLDHLEPKTRRRLTQLADRLRAEMLKLAEANRVVELVCREMLAHFKTLFTVMMKDDGTPLTYSADGEIGPSAGARVLDALG